MPDFSLRLLVYFDGRGTAADLGGMGGFRFLVVPVIATCWISVFSSCTRSRVRIRCGAAITPTGVEFVAVVGGPDVLRVGEGALCEAELEPA